MTVKPAHILLLAGTFEARKLAQGIPETFPDAGLTVSFAGVVSDLPDLGVRTRIGGFGGLDGLKTFMGAEGVTHIIDATHPFAAQMSRTASEAASALSVPLVRLERPAWSSEAEDQWQSVPGVAAAEQALRPGGRVFLAVGRKEIGKFTGRTDIYGLVRMIEPPAEPLPDTWDLVLSRPSQDVVAEIDLFKRHGIDCVVSKNSGGTRSFAKIAAARALQLPVIMIERPLLPEAVCASSPSAVLEKLARLLA
ncbi:cobalt-precorrin-6A reductase [Roseibium denhamense]|uniref:cobalt-precorrin-6A reductase n=1 Tax=Roseibium denhamense TaxID=76305 RepID=UPI0012BBE5A4|nr:cobalt-precorrin-6A reductase [Roseibium denhamense]MTI05568.1 cobalt-precorrin-6A reductase [Roseibium denhamense]